MLREMHLLTTLACSKSLSKTIMVRNDGILKLCKEVFTLVDSRPATNI